MTWRQRLANAIERIGLASTADLVEQQPATFGPREKWGPKYASGGEAAPRQKAPSDGRYILLGLNEQLASPGQCGHPPQFACVECGEWTCLDCPCACYRDGDVETR